MRISNDLLNSSHNLYTITDHKLVKIKKVCFTSKQAATYAKRSKSAVLVLVNGGVAYFSTIKEMRLGRPTNE